VAGAKRTRLKQTKKRDEIVTPGPNRGGLLREGQPSRSPQSEVRRGGCKSRQGHKYWTWTAPIATPPPGQDLAVTRQQERMAGRVCRATVRGRQRAGAGRGRPSDSDHLGRARGQHATSERTSRLAAAGDDEDGGSAGGARGRRRRGRAAGAGGWRGPGKRRRWPTSRLPYGTR